MIVSIRVARQIVALSLLVLPLRADTWVVTPDGSGDFTEISAAVAFAVEGDVIWVKPGCYGPVHILGKSVEVVAIEPDEVVVEEIEVSGLQETQRVGLAGLSVSRPSDGAQLIAALRIIDCQGSVRVKDCRLGFSTTSCVQLQRGPAVEIDDSEDVAFSRCVTKGVFSAAPGSKGVLHAVESSIALYECGMKGYGGQPAVKLIDSRLFASDSYISGWDGWSGYGYCGDSPEDGGPGLIAEGDSVIHQLGGTIRGGSGGAIYGFPCCDMGYDGEALILGPRVSYTELSDTPRNWSCDNLHSKTGRLSVEYHGAPGDRVYVMRSQVGAYREMFEIGGVLLIEAPFERFFLGVADAQGNLRLNYQPPPAELLEPAAGPFYQAYAVDLRGGVWLAGSSAVATVPRSLTPNCGRVIHVDPQSPPGGDGSSWSQAVPDLHVALELAREDLEFCGIAAPIWMKGGTYLPPVSVGVNDFAYDLDVPVAIYGGFAGTESRVDERVSGAFPTILSADRLGDDRPGFVNREDNAAGIILAQSQYIQDTKLFDGLTFAGARMGGAMYLSYVDEVTVRGCEFVENESRGSLFRAALKVEECERVELVNSRFHRQRFDQAGCVELDADLALVTSCVFTENRFLPDTAESWGCSGLNLNSISRPNGIARVTNSMFRGNVGGWSAGILAAYANLEVSNCSFLDGWTQSRPAGLTLHLPGDVRVTNSVFWGNVSGALMGEAAQLGPSNSSAHLDLELRNSCVFGLTGVYPGQGNIGQDPLLDHDSRPSPGSPCIDAGANAFLPRDEFDVDGNGNTHERLPLDVSGAKRRIDDPNTADSGSGAAPVVDMGALEFQA